MAGLTTYVFLLFGVSIALYCCGFVSPLMHVMQCTGTTLCAPTESFASSVLNSLTNLISNPAFFIPAALAIIVPFVASGSFSMIYIIPILMIFALSNFLILPTDFLLTTTMPVFLSTIILGFLNLLLLMAVISFVRGGD